MLAARHTGRQRHASTLASDAASQGAVSTHGSALTTATRWGGEGGGGSHIVHPHTCHYHFHQPTPHASLFGRDCRDLAVTQVLHGIGRDREPAEAEQRGVVAEESGRELDFVREKRRQGAADGQRDDLQ